MLWRRMGEWWYSSTILDLGTRWRWVVSFTPQPLYPKEKAPSTHWKGGWVGPRAGLDAVEKTEIPWPSREWNPGHAARRHTNWATGVNINQRCASTLHSCSRCRWCSVVQLWFLEMKSFIWVVYKNEDYFLVRELNWWATVKSPLATGVGPVIGSLCISYFYINIDWYSPHSNDGFGFSLVMVWTVLSGMMVKFCIVMCLLTAGTEQWVKRSGPIFQTPAFRDALFKCTVAMNVPE
jgi:hypothetical protein